MTDADAVQTIRIPCEPYGLGDTIPSGLELELVPIGVHGVSRHRVAADCVRQVRDLLPCRPRTPLGGLDTFSAVGRFYLEMGEFVEVAGVTCDSPEAVAWVLEAAFCVLGRITATAGGRTIPLCHTPSDYNDYTSGGRARPHSAGAHTNLLCRRPLDPNQFEVLASILCPLNTVFGPGGLTWTDQVPRFTCDPRADHVARLLAGRAHGEVPKPFILRRDEPFADSPSERIQVVAFGGPRSPVSSWLRAELLTWALRAVLYQEKPPFRVVDPIKTLRAAPEAKVALEGRGRRTVQKAPLAIETICWLADSTHKRSVDPFSARRVDCIRQLSCAAVAACVDRVTEPPVFPTDIPVKRYLFNHIAQTHGYADLSSLGRAQAAAPANDQVKKTMDSIIVADILFTSPSLNHSTYELAARSGVFLRPEFEHRVDIENLTSLPPGVCQRDRIRADMLVAGNIECCDWNHLVTTEGAAIALPNPWSAITST